ncbi:hypothetical protein Pla110_26350 [Polystyrenella longa]|uniref:DUF4149 domain-containing protein n=1 Tax=Polystyrenella longa TaxID=2528007 RepID=A0A518CNU8_9PLAN|nr:hypothetical protein [Polystyrenella longa]QDU80899.1 hypothetical protein Pla110_26350 [Polystyrenella longa]
MAVLRQLSFVLSRLLISGWVGAAALFVVTSVAEQTNSEFDSMVRDQLALIRFPYYYLFGFIMVGGSLGSLLFSDRSQYWMRWWISVGLLSLTLIIMLVDYFAIFMPLKDILSDAGGAKPQEFVAYHEYSEKINMLHVTLSLICACILCSVGMGKSKARS